MTCPNCGTVHESGTYCTACGAALAPAQPTVYPGPPVQPPIPDNYKPLSPWGYFGLNLLFSIPVVGFIFLIIFSCSNGNINRRNYARSFFCNLIIVAVLVLIYILLGVAVGTAFSVVDFSSMLA